MFLSDQRTLPVGLAAVRARLANLIRDGRLSGASQTAYQEGLDHLRWAGPFGSPSGLSRLVEVRFVEPVERAGAVITGMRWEATGATGRSLPALDANITLTPEGDQNTRMKLAGVYRSPFEPLGAGLDRVLLHKVATATIHSLMNRLGAALEGAPPHPEKTRPPNQNS